MYKGDPMDLELGAQLNPVHYQNSQEFTDKM